MQVKSVTTPTAMPTAVKTTSLLATEDTARAWSRSASFAGTAGGVAGGGGVGEADGGGSGDSDGGGGDGEAAWTGGGGDGETNGGGGVGEADGGCGQRRSAPGELHLAPSHSQSL